MSAWTFHGGRLREAQSVYGGDSAAWLDLSTGINPRPWPHAFAVPVDWAALPDEQALAELERVAADYFGIDPAHICALPGTEIGLRLAGDLLPDRAAHMSPGYRTYRAVAHGPGVTADGLAAASGRSLVLGNPNNPDGRSVGRERLSALLDGLAGSEDWLIVDEAFADVRPEASIAGEIGDDARLIVFRSFGKFFGLAGLRLGFVLGPRVVIAHFRDRLGSWPVSAAAIAIGARAYRDADWIAAERLRLRADAAALDEVLAAHGLTPTGDCPLFRLVETKEAASLFERLARRAILTRPFDYAPNWLRIGLPGSAEALDRFDRALADG